MTTETTSFMTQLRAGKLEWTREEFAACWLEKKADGTLGPTNKARVGLVSRAVAEVLGIEVTSGYGTLTFGALQSTVPGSVEIKYVDRIIEKIVEKRVQVPELADKGDKCPVSFPSHPLKAEANTDYVKPAWYKRMAAVLDNTGKGPKHVSIAGPPGGGKSTAPEQYFIAKGQPFVTINGDAGFRRRDMEGNVEISGGNTFFEVAEFAAAAVNGWGVILNEVNAADPDALMYINGLLEVPFVVNIHGKAYPVHPDFRLVITFNPGLIGTKALPLAFKDRFFPIKLGFPPKAFLRKMLVAKGMIEGCSYEERILKYAADCWALHEKGNLRYQISPRRLFDLVFLMDTVPGITVEEAISQAIIESVDSPADATMLKTLVTSPLKDIGAVSQFA